MAMEERISIALTAVLAVCALIITGLVVRQQLFSSPSSSRETQTIEEWRQVATTGRLLGPEEAPVKIVEFFDYQCPYCRTMHPVLKQIRERYPSKIALSYLHLPLEMHEHAFSAALASECAARQNRFARYHNLLFANQDRLGEVSWDNLALTANVPDLEAFRSCMQQKRPVQQVRQDIQVAERLGIHSVPTLLVNETLVSGALSLQELNRLVQEALQQQQQ